jgi:hypothetical protein
MPLGNKHGHAGTLRFVVLPGDIENLRTDDRIHIGQYLGQSLSVVHLVDVLDVASLLLLGLGVADIIDIEAQRLGEVVEAMQLKFFDIHRVNDTPSNGGTAKGQVDGKKITAWISSEG